MKRQAAHMSLFIQNTSHFFAFCSITTTDVWIKITEAEINNDKLSNKKNIKTAFLPMCASPSENPSVLSSTYTVKMEAKATVAIRTATTVAWLMALLRPLM